ncbi:MAG: addiction module toxin, HicA family [Candidatus Omnitrophota bacterium]|nr:MAG: addiction module toxin, HicA family [Candidatus Omnitrophota bacterium]
MIPKEMARVVERLGFVFDHQRGSHAYYVHPYGRTTTIAMHSKDLPRGIMKKILRDININEEEFRKLL